MRMGSFLLGTVLLSAILLAPAQAVQDQKLQHTSSDPYKCKACSPALQKALAFLKKKGAGADGHRQCLIGFVRIAANDAAGLQKCVKKVSGGFYKQGGFNGNWSVAMSAIFLSEVYRRQPTEQLKGKILDLLKYAAKNQEPGGGWSHNLGFSYGSGDPKKGGCVDLGILTSMMYGAMLSFKKQGIPVDPDMFKKAEKNVKANRSGSGVAYGTGNGAGDRAMSRGAWAYIGVHAAKATTSWLWKSVPTGLKSGYKTTDDGHAYPPLHYTAVAYALHLIGPTQYDKFFKEWADKLIGLQKEDGSIELPHSESIRIQGDDGYVGSTASFALILLLQRPGALKGGKKGKGGGKGDDVATGGIFGGKNKNKKPADGAPYFGAFAKNSGFGVSVTSVKKGGAADKAGVKKGDLIVSFNDKTFDDFEGLKKLVAKTKPGQSAKITVLRNGDKKVLTAKVGVFKKSTLGTTALKSDEF